MTAEPIDDPIDEPLTDDDRVDDGEDYEYRIAARADEVRALPWARPTLRPWAPEPNHFWSRTG